ncbi:Protein CBG27131 [Caenorhabditis briggsae]|uniref:Protein CBG27131 n=1 Tax=Caenorhabditis briggsae TaxID=6238 RepID=B6IL41_CAEBR|nr:Protein CBG27131 [Caenorhabditis briggsae]CAS00594.1 Protein CBG27131 [Caenorhabditis briggsae]
MLKFFKRSVKICFSVEKGFLTKIKNTPGEKKQNENKKTEPIEKSHQLKNSGDEKKMHHFHRWNVFPQRKKTKMFSEPSEPTIRRPETPTMNGEETQRQRERRLESVLKFVEGTEMNEFRGKMTWQLVMMHLLEVVKQTGNINANTDTSIKVHQLVSSREKKKK